jgi:hypothetical protein
VACRHAGSGAERQVGRGGPGMACRRGAVRLGSAGRVGTAGVELGEPGRAEGDRNRVGPSAGSGWPGKSARHGSERLVGSLMGGPGTARRHGRVGRVGRARSGSGRHGAACQGGWGRFGSSAGAGAWRSGKSAGDGTAWSVGRGGYGMSAQDGLVVGRARYVGAGPVGLIWLFSWARLGAARRRGAAGRAGWLVGGTRLSAACQRARAGSACRQGTVWFVSVAGSGVACRRDWAGHGLSAWLGSACRGVACRHGEVWLVARGGLARIVGAGWVGVDRFVGGIGQGSRQGTARSRSVGTARLGVASRQDGTGWAWPGPACRQEGGSGPSAWCGSGSVQVRRHGAVRERHGLSARQGRTGRGRSAGVGAVWAVGRAGCGRVSHSVTHRVRYAPGGDWRFVLPVEQVPHSGSPVAVNSASKSQPPSGFR